MANDFKNKGSSLNDLLISSFESKGIFESNGISFKNKSYKEYGTTNGEVKIHTYSVRNYKIIIMEYRSRRGGIENLTLTEVGPIEGRTVLFTASSESGQLVDDCGGFIGELTRQQAVEYIANVVSPNTLH